MKQVAQNYKTGELSVRIVPSPSLRPGGVLVRSAASLISAGTERTKTETARMSLLQKARSRPDQVRKVLETLRKEGYASTYRKVMGKLDSLSPLGYSSAGTVVAVGDGVPEFRVGDRVACAGAGFANHAEQIFVPANLCVPIPGGVGLAEAAFTTVGAIALQGVRQAEVRLGETVAVIGLGLVGQLTVMLLKAAGCRVLGIDLDPWTVELARKNGADLSIVRGADPAVRAAEMSAGAGLDAVIITAGTKSNDPIELAAKILRDRGRVVVVGAVGMAVPRDPYYMKELDLRLSRSYGPGRYDVAYEEKGRDYPIGYVRWTEKRNMAAFLDLVAQGKIRFDEVLTHRFPVDRAPEAYDMLTGKSGERYLGIVLEYDSERKLETVVPLPGAPQRSSARAGIGFIGAGSFAKSQILPHLSGAVLRGIHTGSGLTAVDVGEKSGFAFAAGSPEGVLEDPQTGAVFIVTRHDTHAQLAQAALEKGLAAFVEKPLALNDRELEGVVEAAKTGGGRLLVGFNRRFAPMTRLAIEHFGDRKFPLAINIRVNAGAMPKDSWIQDRDIGGGRIVGEACHFIDLAVAIAGAPVTRVFAEALFDSASGTRLEDSLSMVLRLEDGSMASIQYLANGDTTYPKEHVEIFGAGRMAVIDDFRALTLVRDGVQRVVKAAGQDKGHKAEIEAFLSALKSGDPMAISLPEIQNVTSATFRVIDSLRSGLPQAVLTP